MTQEEKDLLLKDLCARQMNGIKCKVFNDTKPYILSGILHNKPYGQLYFDELDWKEFDGFVSVKDCKPYLFPLSSMTEEQKEELNNIFDLDVENAITHIKNGIPNLFTGLNRLNWFIKNHFDIYGLIPMGLAIDATDKNIY